MNGSYEDLIRSMSDAELEAAKPLNDLNTIYLNWCMVLGVIVNKKTACRVERLVLGQHFKKYYDRVNAFKQKLNNG